MEQVEKKRHTIEEYNRLEEEQQQRYEYHDGEIFAMAGAATDVGDPKHSAIASNLIGLLSSFRREGNEVRCRPYNSDLRIYIEKFNKILYPDVSVFCGKKKRADRVPSAYTNPILIIEVTSASTGNYDAQEKFW